MLNAAKGHSALRRGRFSESGTCYFLTVCTEQRNPGLENASLTPRLLQQVRDPACGWRPRTAVVMPDHIHLLAELTDLQTLSGAVRLFKGRSAGLLRSHDMKWQRGYYDHRLRPEDNVLSVFLYVFLNPFRAGLVDTTSRWPGYWCSDDDWSWFGDLTNTSCPFPEWLA